MTYRVLALTLLTLLSGAAFADSTENYRAAFMKNCTDGDSDPQNRKMCACVFDEWQAGLPSKNDPNAINAAKIMSNSEVDLYPSEIQAAMVHSGDMTAISSRCADRVLGKISLGGDTAANEADDVNYDLPSGGSADEPQVEGKKRGMLGAMVGWAGRKAGLPDMLNDAAADKVDENESTIKSKLNPLNSRFNPFKKKKSDDAEAASEE